jgi:hypothetical protein
MVRAGYVCPGTLNLFSYYQSVLPHWYQVSDVTLVYLGDSATLSFLQLIRMNVESVAGESAFTQDPQRFWIVERKSSLPANHLHTHLLPDRQTANILVESFLTNVSPLY